jgi:hypothetical protein
MATAEQPYWIVDETLKPMYSERRRTGTYDPSSRRDSPARIDELAGKCDEGVLTAEKRAEYETYIRFRELHGHPSGKGSPPPDTVACGLIDAAARQEVRRQVGFCCEYCHIQERHLPFSAFYLDHVAR